MATQELLSMPLSIAEQETPALIAQLDHQYLADPSSQVSPSLQRFMNRLEAIGYQRDMNRRVLGSRDHVEYDVGKMIEAHMSGDREQYIERRHSLITRNLSGGTTYDTLPRAASMLLRYRQYDVLADLTHVLAKREDHEIVTGILALPEVTSGASIQARLSLTQSLIRITDAMRARDAQDPRLHTIAHDTIRLLRQSTSQNPFDHFIHLFGKGDKKRLNNTAASEEQVMHEEVTHNLVTALAMTHTSEAQKFMRKHSLDPVDYDMVTKPPVNRYEFLTRLDFISRRERNMSARDEYFADSFINSLLTLEEQEDHTTQFNHEAAAAFVYGYRDPDRNYRSDALPRITTRMLQEGRYDSLAKFVNALAQGEDYAILSGLLALPEIQQASPEAQRLIAKALIRISYDIRQTDPQDPRLGYIADSLIQTLQTNTSEELIEDALFGLQMTRTSQATAFMEHYGIDPRTYDESHLPDDYFERYEFGDRAWNEFYWEAVRSFESSYSVHILPEDAYMALLQDNEAAVKEYLRDPFYFPRVVESLHWLYKRGVQEKTNNKGETHTYTEMYTFARRFIYENMDTLETMMRQENNLHLTKSVMEAVRDLYATGDISHEKLTDFLLRNLPFALEQKLPGFATWYGEYWPQEDLRAMYTYGSEQQKDQVNQFVTGYYEAYALDGKEATQEALYDKEYATDVLLRLPHAIILLQQNNEEKDITYAAIRTAHASREQELTTTLGYDIGRLYASRKSQKHTEGETLVRMVMEVYGLNYDGYIDAWKDSDGYYKDADSTMKNFRRIVDLENLVPGIARRLTRYFNIKTFADDDIERQIQQDVERLGKGEYAAFAEAIADWTGYKYFWFSDRVLQETARATEEIGLPLRRVDIGDEVTALEMLLRMKKRYGQTPKITILEGHSDKEEMTLQSFGLWQEKFARDHSYDRDGVLSTKNITEYATSEDFVNPFSDGDILIINGCGAGKPGGLAEVIARAFGITVIASEEKGSLKEIKLARDKNGDIVVEKVVFITGRDFLPGVISGPFTEIEAAIYDGKRLQQENPLVAPHKAQITPLDQVRTELASYQRAVIA